jgi:hypothetical protein
MMHVLHHLYAKLGKEIAQFLKIFKGAIGKTAIASIVW